MKLVALALFFGTMMLYGATAPPVPPTIVTSVAGDVIKGKAADARYTVRVKVFGETGEPLYKDGLVDARDNSFGVILPTAAGQIVQAFLLVNGEERAPSRPVAIKAPPVPTVTAPTVTAATLPVDRCATVPADSGFPQPSISNLTSDSTHIKGDADMASGAVMVCVNGKAVNIKSSDSGAASPSVSFTGGKYDVILGDAQLKENNSVVVVITSDATNNPKQRFTAIATVAASTAPSAAKPCTAPADDPPTFGPIVFDPAPEDGTKKISGTSPLPDGSTVVACLAGKPLVSTDTAATAVSGGKFTLSLANGLKEGNSVDVLITSADLKHRVKTSLTIAPVKFRFITFKTPQEGQRTLYVNASPTGSVNYSLAAFINGEQQRVIDGSGNETDSVPTSSTSGSTALQLKDPLDGGQCVQVVEFQTGKQLVVEKTLLGCPMSSSVAPKDNPANARIEADYSLSDAKTVTAFFDFGRIRSYLVAGSLLTFDGGNFSQPSVFLALNANRNWIWGGFTPKVGGSETVELRNRFMFDTFFEARLTTVPTAACVTGSTGTCSPATVQSTLTSAKAAELLTGVSMPIILSTWKRGIEHYGFSMGPIAKVGFLTPVGSQDSGTAQAVSPQSFYTNFGFGTRFGFHKLTATPDVAPELMSYIDVVSGRFANFDFNPDPTKRYNRPWRFGFEGLLKVPSTPFFVGFSANVHQNFGLGGATTVDHARDDLRFLFGAKFDAGKLFDAIGQIK